jgi:hypothetical protein
MCQIVFMLSISFLIQKDVLAYTYNPRRALEKARALLWADTLVLS